ncbi:MAG: hypothetical protein KH301_05225 [Brachyspira sp.]|nr:hypothetical protein [Brachyspira sp.]
MMKKLILTSLILLNASFVYASDIEPAKIPTVQNRNTCPKPFYIITPCTKMEKHIDDKNGIKHIYHVCIERKQACSNEKIEPVMTTVYD